MDDIVKLLWGNSQYLMGYCHSSTNLNYFIHKETNKVTLPHTELIG